jgi:integrase
MRPKERRETGDQDLFRSRPDQIIDLDHALVKLAGSRSIAPSPMPDIAATTRRPIVSASRHRSNASLGGVPPSNRSQGRARAGVSQRSRPHRKPLQHPATRLGSGADRCRRGDGEGQNENSGLHSLRHFYASWCINRCVDGGLELPLKVVQARLGHASVQMTADRYGHLFPRGDDGAELAAAEQAFSVLI